MGTHYSPRIVTDKLVMYTDSQNPKSYPGSGSSLYNLITKYPYTGTFGGGTPPTVDSDGNLRVYGDASGVAFPESNISKNPSVFLGGSQGQLTYECWVYRLGTSVGSDPRIMSTDYSDYTAIYISGRGSGSIRFGVDDISGVINAGSVSQDVWTHVCGTYDAQVGGTNHYLYVNGVEIGSAATVMGGNYGRTSSRPFALGSNVEATVQYNNSFNGYINVARIYGKALSPSEVTQNFNAHKTRFGL